MGLCDGAAGTGCGFRFVRTGRLATRDVPRGTLMALEGTDRCTDSRDVRSDVTDDSLLTFDEHEGEVLEKRCAHDL